MKEDHFGINVEREYKMNHGRKANQIRMSKLTGINAKRFSHEKCGLEIRKNDETRGVFCERANKAA